MPPKLLPKQWTIAELTRDAAIATADFRRERLEEPFDKYNEFFATYAEAVRSIIPLLPKLGTATEHVIADLVRTEPKRRAMCYLTAPPTSEDDLKTISQTTLAPTPMLKDPERAFQVRSVIWQLLDQKRFPWVSEERPPTKHEVDLAVTATAALIANTKVQTGRRTKSKDTQEGMVKDLLRDMGFEEVPVRQIPTFAHAPKARQFMGETAVAGAQGDVILGLPDSRILIVECKVSNSALNSRKRLKHDTGGKATTWYSHIGKANIVVAAVLNGVFKVSEVEFVQNDLNVSLFWDHRLDDLREFIKSVPG